MMTPMTEAEVFAELIEGWLKPGTYEGLSPEELRVRALVCALYDFHAARLRSERFCEAALPVLEETLEQMIFAFGELRRGDNDIWPALQRLDALICEYRHRDA